MALGGRGTVDMGVQVLSEGGDDREYADLQRDYEDIAEGTMKSEAIPLARRDYIRQYFEALRPKIP